METFDIINLWANKSDDDKDHYSLLYHMLDIVAVTNQLWKNCLHQGAKHFMAGELNLSNNEYEAGKWLAFSETCNVSWDSDRIPSPYMWG